jgi:Niemann-Pick C1 protein
MGLAVDYSAHVALNFITIYEGDRNECVQKTLIHIGPAVVNGGFSTFLAFALLMTSQ